MNREDYRPIDGVFAEPVIPVASARAATVSALAAVLESLADNVSAELYAIHPPTGSWEDKAEELLADLEADIVDDHGGDDGTGFFPWQSEGWDR